MKEGVDAEAGVGGTLGLQDLMSQRQRRFNPRIMSQMGFEAMEGPGLVGGARARW